MHNGNEHGIGFIETNPELARIRNIFDAIKTGSRAIDNDIQRNNVTEAVIRIGPSRNGKSTVGNWLAGAELYSDDGETIKARPEHMRIGHSVQSETNQPLSWADNGNGIIYWDCPGFGDFREQPLTDIPQVFFIQKLFAHYTNIKVMLVIEESGIQHGNANGFIKLMQDIGNIFPSSPEEYNRYKEGLSIVVTKTAMNRGMAGIINNLSDVAATFERQGNIRLAAIIKNIVNRNAIGMLNSPTNVPDSMSFHGC